MRTASVLQVRELSRELHGFGGRRGSSKPMLVSTEPPACLQGRTKPPRGMLLYAIHCPLQLTPFHVPSRCFHLRLEGPRGEGLLPGEGTPSL